MRGEVLGMPITRRHLLVGSLALALAAPVAARGAGFDLTHRVDPTTLAQHDTEPVVLTGASFPAWAAPAEVTAEAPGTGGALCQGGQASACTHNQYETPTVDSSPATKQVVSGVAVGRLLGYKWQLKGNGDGHFVQIPFQVDEVATRYLSNNNSGFAFYSETDQHQTYVFDQERFRWTRPDPNDPCHALADGPPTTPDNVPGLDTNDELSFMASDGLSAAPSGAGLPNNVVGSYTVALTDPQTGDQSYVYVMLAAAKNGPKPAFDASNGYVHYVPDADSDTFLYSQSSYRSYGATYEGAYLDPATGTCVIDPAKAKQHRPKDTAWVKTPRYEFRYDGRWLMTEIRVASPAQEQANSTTGTVSSWTYGPDLIDQWKARAFQQRPGGQTPCCGYEEEVNNWGGSSMLMGWRAGPVRVIRATWGADSSTNNIRTEVFYRDELHQLDNLRVHVIPPFDGIYSQWDYNAGKMTEYYNPYQPQGVKVDGQNDEIFGNNKMRICGDGVGNQTSDPTPVVGPLTASVGATGDCSGPTKGVNNDIDTYDPTLSGPDGTLNWEETAGPYGIFVDRTTVKQVTGGTAYSLVTTPYYRDDSCFDDGTGSDPGLHLNPKNTDPSVDSQNQPRACWAPSDGDPAAYPPDHFYQGDIGTHGVHIELIADSDNAMQTVPVDEISSDMRRVILPPDGKPTPGSYQRGEAYGRGVERPLAVAVTPTA